MMSFLTGRRTHLNTPSFGNGSTPLITSSSGVVAKYCDEYICVCVCVCVRLSVRLSRAIFTKFLCMLHAYGHGSVLLRRCCDTLCIEVDRISVSVSAPKLVKRLVLAWFRFWYVKPLQVSVSAETVSEFRC